jgi:predicted nucleic acid-binding protein
VDTGAWIALALSADPLHPRARETWERLTGDGVACCTSVPVVLETFTFLDRNARRDVAVAWKDSLKSVRRLEILPSTARDLDQAWPYFDAHFATAGFRIVG